MKKRRLSNVGKTDNSTLYVSTAPTGVLGLGGIGYFEVIPWSTEEDFFLLGCFLGRHFLFEEEICC